MDYAIKTVREILAANKPLFGICTGNQLLALACGISTYKMHHGHRGLNHQLRTRSPALGEMTSQNHGFAVSEKDIERNPDVEVTHLHLNDQTIMGIRLKSKKAFFGAVPPGGISGARMTQCTCLMILCLWCGKQNHILPERITISHLKILNHELH